jgi:hypothetical protein
MTFCGLESDPHIFLAIALQLSPDLTVYLPDFGVGGGVGGVQ